MIYKNRSRLQIKLERLKTGQIIKQMSFHIIDNEVKAAISWTIASSYPQVNLKGNRDYTPIRQICSRVIARDWAEFGGETNEL